MKEYKTEQIRNIALAGHATAGKTSLAEAMLFVTGDISRMGSIDEGTTVSDYHADEIERKNSISASMLHCIRNEHKLNIIDLPGYPDFIGEIDGGLRAADLAVIVLNARRGVELGAETSWTIAEQNNLSRIIFVNKLDKENVNFDETLVSIEAAFGNKTFPVVYPVSTTEYIDLLHMKLQTYDQTGKITIGEIPNEHQEKAQKLREKLIENTAECNDTLLEKYFDSGKLTDDEIKKGLSLGIAQGSIYPIIAGVATEASGIAVLIDFIIDYCPPPHIRGEITGTAKDHSTSITREQTDDAPFSALAFKILSEAHLGELSFFRIFSGKLSPNTEVYNSSQKKSEKLGQLYVMNGKSRKEAAHLHTGDIGAVVKLHNTHTGNTLCDSHEPILLPNIPPASPLMTIAISPKTKGDDDKMATGLHTLQEEDSSFSVKVDPELHQVLLMGQSELHLNVILKRLKEKYHVEVDTAEAKIPYRENVVGKAKNSYRHKKQSGGAGQFGEVYLYLEPYKEGAPVPKEFNARDTELDELSWGGKLEFINAIVGGSIDARFIPAVKKGILEIMQAGAVAGYPVTDIRVILYDGKMHPVDSNENAFKSAGKLCFRKVFQQAKPILLEPIMEVEITVPDEFMGDVMGEMSGHRGKILGMAGKGKNQVIKATAPQKEMAKYSTKLRSMTQGHGVYTQQFLQYEEVPKELAEQLIQEYEIAKSQGH